jgi:hypothetical protein
MLSTGKSRDLSKGPGPRRIALVVVGSLVTVGLTIVIHGPREEIAARIRGRVGRKRARSGQAYVEFVIVVLPMLLIILFLWEISYYSWSRMVVASATYEAAREVATGGTMAGGQAIYDDLLTAGLGGLADQHRGHFRLTRVDGLRSVYAAADVPYAWPKYLESLGVSAALRMRATALFRIEEFYGGPGDEFE